MAYFLSQTLVAAKGGAINCTLAQLLTEYEYDLSSLEGISKLKETLEFYQLQIDPEIGKDDLLCERTLKPIRSETEIQQVVGQILEAGGEKFNVELKSSICIDTLKMKHAPGLENIEYLSKPLMAKAAQEIASFLNRDGGSILFGVSNELEILGCLNDFQTVRGDGTPQDKADLLIRKIVEKHFYEPKIALSHIHIECEQYNGCYLVLVTIVRMRSLAFLKTSDEIRHSLYRRIGTSAQSIPFHEVETHYELSSKS